MLTFHYHYFIETQSVFSNKSNIYKQIFFSHKSRKLSDMRALIAFGKS